MNEVVRPKRRRFQFGLRRLLLWTAVVALGFGTLSTLYPSTRAWVVLPGWCAVVLILRWGFGSTLAASVSTIVGMVLGLLLPEPQEPLDFVVYAIDCGFFGLVLFVLAEVTCQIVDWIDRIRQSDE